MENYKHETIVLITNEDFLSWMVQLTMRHPNYMLGSSNKFFEVQFQKLLLNGVLELDKDIRTEQILPIWEEKSFQRSKMNVCPSRRVAENFF
jgi:hypothetical protein